MMIYGVNNVPIPQKYFNVTLVSAVRPSSATENVRRGVFY